MEDTVKVLLEKARRTDDAVKAMNYAQAACNAANALRALAETANTKKHTESM